MTIEVYKSESNNTITVIEKGKEDALKHLESDAVLLREITGQNIDDCMQQHYELMGWGPYKSFTD